MNYKLFFSTFLLIFLAEIGDKTQLTAMARAATGDSSKWTVFAAASLALALSTLIAVLFGSTFTRLVPEKYIKMAAGLLFLLFGLLTLRSALVPEKAKRVEAGSAVLAPVVLRLAAAFEEAAADDYEKLAVQASDARVRDLLLALAAEERSHLSHVRELQPKVASPKPDTPMPQGLPEKQELMHDVAGDSRELIAHAVEHETATRRFYEELARVVHVPGLAASFSRLAEEESEHVRRLQDLGRELKL